MFAVTGTTGKVGGLVARTLLAQGKKVRAVVRSAEKGDPWKTLGCDIAVADVLDPSAMSSAFKGTEGVFLMAPPNYDPEPGYPQTIAAVEAVKQAVGASHPGKVVFLSTVGAHVSEPNLLNNSKMFEEMLRMLPVPVGFVRAAWFMENAAWDVDAARNGLIQSFLQPLDHPLPMIATPDIAQVAVELLEQSWDGLRIVELEGPKRYSANDIAAGLSAALGTHVKIEAVPREQWETLFRSHGMNNPMPRIRMLDGFNEGWIDFEGGKTERRKGTTTLDEVLQSLVKA